MNSVTCTILGECIELPVLQPIAHSSSVDKTLSILAEYILQILSSSYVYCLLDIDDIDAREWLKPGVGVHPTPPTPAPVAEAGAKF